MLQLKRDSYVLLNTNTEVFEEKKERKSEMRSIIFCSSEKMKCNEDFSYLGQV